MVSMTLVVVVIALALLFDFLNGFHDAANAIATIVVTRTLTPFQAVLLAGAANFAGYFFFGVTIATMVGKGIVDPSFITIPIILAALIGAITWNIITWIFGIPSSSSHALIGGLVGSTIVAVGLKAVILKGVIPVFCFIFIAPFLGLLGAMIFTIIIMWLFRRSHYRRSNKWFKKLQLFSATLYSIGHGTNDAQKTMGIIALVLLTAGISSTFHVPVWVALSCQSAIAIGTVFGGWRIVKTMGTNITKIRAREGFCAESSSAAVLFSTAHMGIPVSTTHVISGSIMGVGTVEGAKGVRWKTARRIIYAWLLTIPVTMIIGAIMYLVVNSFI